MKTEQELLSDSKRNLLAKNVPVLTHIDQLKKQTAELKDDFEHTNLMLNNIKLEVMQIENDMFRNNETDLNFLLDEIARLDREFRLHDTKDDAEVDYLKGQAQGLFNDKFKITQNVLLLEERINRIDDDIGF